MNRLSFSKPALYDLEEIWNYYALVADVEFAELFLGRVDRVLRKRILLFAASGRSRPELGPDIRSFGIPPYVIFYRRRATRVHVERILHGRRDLREPLMSLLVAI